MSARSLRWLVAAAAVAGALMAAVAPAMAATAGASSAGALAISKELLAITHGPGTSVDVFEEITLSAPSPKPWQVPLPHGAYRIAPQSPDVRVGRGGVITAAGQSGAAVVYRLPGRLGSVFVEDVSLSVGKVSVLAAPGVYPGLGTGLTLHGQTRIGGKLFTLFSGGSEGPGGVVHFSLTVGDPGRPWADGVGVVLVLWLAAGAYLGSRRLMAILRNGGGQSDAA